MPFLTLEHSDNLIEKPALVGLFQKIHTQLSEELKIPASAFFSSALSHQSYCTGNDAENSAFVHITFKLMRGRSPEVLHTVAESILTLSKNFLEATAKKFQLRMTLEMIELQRTPVKEGYSLSNQLPISLVF